LNAPARFGIYLQMKWLPPVFVTFVFVFRAFGQTNQTSIPSSNFWGLMVVCGDSLSSENNGKSNWTQFYDHSDCLIINLGHGGFKLQEMRERYSLNADFIKTHNLTNAFPTNAAGWFILQGGHGDLYSGGRNADQMIEDAKQILSWAKADGYRTVICTVSSSPLLYKSNQARPEAERQKYNTLLRQNNLADRLVDLDLLVPPEPYFRQEDGLHFSDLAELRVAADIAIQLKGHSN
jgi:hypothetical protein